MPSFKRGLRSLFARTAAAIALALIVYDLFSHAVIGYYVLHPVAKRSADDLAALIVHTAHDFGPEALDRLDEIAANHGLLYSDANEPLPVASYSPYVRYLEDALLARIGEPVQVMQRTGGDDWLWIDVPAHGTVARLGFAAQRLDVHTMDAVFLLLIAAAALTFGTALVYVRRITLPIARLADAAGKVADGDFPEPLPETGPGEIAALTHSFNRMTRQVKEALAARTTLLAGISHDLRTPLARLHLAVEMLPAQPDTELLAGIHRDLEDMNRLIGQFLEVSRGLGDEEHEPIALASLLEDLAQDARRSGAGCECGPLPICTTLAPPTALRRVLVNLLDNATRYGGGKPVRMEIACTPTCTVLIKDRGTGIPAEEREAVFRPFYRLEQSRSTCTGGSGLGLAIARQLAEANRWELELLPRDGGGTVAVLRMPCQRITRDAGGPWRRLTQRKPGETIG